MTEEDDRAGQFELGKTYLDVAKRIVPYARRLEEDDAAALRKFTDQLTEKGLGLLLSAVGGVRKRRRRTPEEMAAERAEWGRGAPGANDRT